MRTQISQHNPHDFPRYAFAWEHVQPGSRAHLDFGCYDGQFLASLRTKRIAALAGVDVSRQAVDAAAKKFPDLDVRLIEPSTQLPFEDASFSSATLLDVIEHVYDQGRLLDELHRVIEPGGTLLVTVPGKHLFSLLDAGNFKFVFPNLHRWHYLRSHTRLEYDQRFVANPEGLIGDISAKKRWHEHFTPSRLGSLLKRSGFDVVLFDGAGLWMRPLALVRMAFMALGGSRGPFDRVMRWDMKKHEAANLFCAARRR